MLEYVSRNLSFFFPPVSRRLPAIFSPSLFHAKRVFGIIMPCARVIVSAQVARTTTIVP
jgi:hypothetical protein